MDRILIEVRYPSGFRDSEDRIVQGWYIGTTFGEGRFGGGDDLHRGAWLVLSDVLMGRVFWAPVFLCREVTQERFPVPTPDLVQR